MRDGALPPGRDPGVAHDQLSQPFFGIADAANRHDDFVADAFETKRHDLEQQRLLAFEVVIQAGLGQTERARDVADRGGVEPARPERLRRRTAHRGAAAVRVAFPVRVRLSTWRYGRRHDSAGRRRGEGDLRGSSLSSHVTKLRLKPTSENALLYGGPSLLN